MLGRAASAAAGGGNEGPALRCCASAGMMRPGAALHFAAANLSACLPLPFGYPSTGLPLPFGDVYYCLSLLLHCWTGLRTGAPHFSSLPWCQHTLRAEHGCKGGDSKSRPWPGCCCCCSCTTCGRTPPTAATASRRRCTAAARSATRKWAPSSAAWTRRRSGQCLIVHNVNMDCPPTVWP